MFEFGDSTNSNREQTLAQEVIGRASNLVTDDLKNHFQFSEALVLGEAEPPINITAIDVETTATSDKVIQMKWFNVLLIREQREIVASIKKDNHFWSTHSAPTSGDYVTIKHRRDLFQAEIIETLSLSLADAMAKYGTITKKAG